VTDVKAEKSDGEHVRVFINGKSSPDARTTLVAAKQVLGMARGQFKVEVSHSCQVPVGAGYGASGAGALGTALALSKALGLRLARQRIVAVAHVAEVVCYTGLGDVGAQALGGLVMGLEPGAPPFGRWKRISVPNDVRVICATLGPIPSKEFLSDAEFRSRARKLGGAAFDEILKRPDIETFFSASKRFAEKLGLLDDELKELTDVAGKAGAIGTGQAMIGRSVFAFASGKKIDAVREAFLEILEPESVVVTRVHDKRASTSTRA